MQFKNLSQKCNYYRTLADHRLLPNSYVLVTIDGRSFSHKIKKKFNLPYDENFVYMMDETAKYVCKNVQGCKFAYVQSDEISFILTDFDTPTTDAFFGNRLCKIQSIIASMATSKFNNLMTQFQLENLSYDKLKDGFYSVNDAIRVVSEMPLYEFDCRAWNVPSYNDVFAHFLWRQIDCVRNSKQVAAQTYIPHKELLNKDTDEQIKKLKEDKAIDWHEYEDGYKYGRFVYKITEMKMIDGDCCVNRNVWKAFPAFPLMDDNGRTNFEKVCVLPKIN